MTTIDAFWIPGLQDDDVDGWHRFEAGPLLLRAPRLTPAALTRLTERLRAAHVSLSTHPVERIVHAIDAVASRLRDHHDPLRITVDAALPALTGYSPPMIRLILDRMAADWQRPQLERLIDAELAGSDALERVVSRRGRSFIAVPYPLLTHVFAGNIPGVAVTSLVRALLVRSASLGKTASREPLLAPLFAAALADQDAILGNALAVTYWPRTDRDAARIAATAADAIIVYGGTDALASARTQAPPSTPVIDHGPRLSAGFVARGAVTDAHSARALAVAAATAIATFDQQGCVSPHAIYVEDTATDPRDFARMISDALATLQQTLPRADLTSDEAAAIRAARARAEFGAFAGRDTVLVSPPDAPFTVLFHGSPDFEPSCLLRTVHVHRVASIDEALHALEPHRTLLQSAALAGGDAATQRRIAHSGFTRITSFANMAWPDFAGHHDGRGPLRELLRMVTVEEN